MKSLILLWMAVSIPAIAQSVKFNLHDNYLIVVKCSVAGEHDLIGILDTGVSETLIDLKLARRLSLPTTPDSATFGTRNAAVEAVSIPDIVFGPLHAQTLSGIAADLSYLTRQFGIRPDILIGMDLLRRGTFVIDYRKKEITFGPLPHLAHSAPLVADPRLLLVQVTVENQTLRLQLDTGINGILIYGGRLHIVPSSSLNSNSNLVGRAVSSQFAVLPHLQFGDWRGTQIAASLTDEEPKGITSFDGLLGPASIGVRRIGFDFQNLLVEWE
jgi:predicted aspartyl protease